MQTTTLSRLLWILRNKMRRRILAKLQSGPWSMGELATSLGVSRSAVRHHLLIMQKAECVKEGRGPGRKVFRLGSRMSVMRYDDRVIFTATTRSGEQVCLSTNARQLKNSPRRRGIGRLLRR